MLFKVYIITTERNRKRIYLEPAKNEFSLR